MKQTSMHTQLVVHLDQAETISLFLKSVLLQVKFHGSSVSENFEGQFSMVQAVRSSFKSPQNRRFPTVFLLSPLHFAGHQVSPRELQTQVAALPSNREVRSVRVFGHWLVVWNHNHIGKTFGNKTLVGTIFGNNTGFIFPYLGNNHTIRATDFHNFQRGGSTTNQNSLMLDERKRIIVRVSKKLPFF